MSKIRQLLLICPTKGLFLSLRASGLIEDCQTPSRMEPTGANYVRIIGDAGSGHEGYIELGDKDT